MGAEIIDFRNPEYTGENRCHACTLVNISIAFILAVLLVRFSILTSTVIFLLSLLIIYFRGYLIPKTPEITKKYLPNSLLELFGKNKSEMNDELGSAYIVDEDLLSNFSIINIENSDITIDDNFKHEWEENMEDISAENIDNLVTKAISEITPMNEDDLSFVQTKPSGWVVVNNGQPISKWISKEAVTIDVSSINTLSEQCLKWDQLSLQERSRVINSLRVLVQICPSCGGDISLNKEYQETCCTSVEVMEIECNNCDSIIDTIEYD